MKICKKCELSKPTSEFGPHKTTKDGFATYCRACDSKRHLEYQQKNPEKFKETWTRRGIERHGLTEVKYESMLLKTGGRCWICNGKPDIGRRLSIDHDHSCCEGRYSCGKCVRGLLCMSCNTMMGKMEGRGVTLSQLQSYLR